MPSTGITWVDTLLEALGEASPRGFGVSDWTEYFLRQQPTTEDAWLAAKAEKAFRPHDYDLTAAEHALFAQTYLGRLGPLAALGLLLAVPGYQAAKALRQAPPGPARWLGQMAESVTGLPMGQASPPSLKQLYWGLRPIFKPLGPSPSIEELPEPTE